MEILQYYEAIFGRPRDAWTRTQWQDVAEQLANEIDAKPQPKRPGRPRLDHYRKDNIPALAFWADQEKQSALLADIKLTEREAVRRVMLASAQDRGLSKWRVNQMLESAVKQVRTFRQELRKRNSIVR
jgi:hypothetical protein